MSQHKPLLDSAIESRALCLGCNYPLRELTDKRCPECGREFDPDRPDTMNLTGRNIGLVGRSLLRPPGWPMWMMSLVAMGYPLWLHRTPGGGFDGSISAVALWFLTGVLWSARIALWFAAARMYGRPVSEFRSGRWCWAVAPALFLIYCLTPQEWPMRVAFALSRSELERIVAQVQADPTKVPADSRAGLYTVRVQAFGPDGVWLFTDCGYDACRYGLAWCPRPPTNNGRVYHHHLTGPWYTYFDAAGYRPHPAKQPSNDPFGPL